MFRNTFFWLKVHQIDGDEPAPDDVGSLIPEAGKDGGAAPADPPADPPTDPPADDKSWFKKDKYKTVEDQAKAYSELEKKLGEKNDLVGAPKEGKYELTMPEGIQGEFIKDDPRMANFMKTAAKMDLSQGAFNEILHSYLMDEHEAIGVSKKAEIKALGENADRRLDSIAKWGGANLDAESYQALRGVATTAAGVKLIEAMIATSREHKMVDPGKEPVGMHGLTSEKLREMAAKKDAHGNLLASVDKEYKKKVDQAYIDFYGNEPTATVVGG